MSVPLVCPQSLADSFLVSDASAIVGSLAEIVYRGPDEEQIGLALCSLHHKAFDLGAFTIQPDHVMLVSELAHGWRDSMRGC